jgi:hypothetical protein
MKSGVEFFIYIIMLVLKRFQILEHFRFLDFWIKDAQLVIPKPFWHAEPSEQALQSPEVGGGQGSKIRGLALCAASPLSNICLGEIWLKQVQF